MTNAVEREIVQLHEFFAGWLGGTLAATPDAFARFDRVIAPSFCIVSPDGEIVTREPLLVSIRDGHGSRPGLEIDVRDVRIRRDEAPWVLATYEEWQREPDSAETARLSSVLLRRRHGLPQGLEWHHVHETWIRGG